MRDLQLDPGSIRGSDCFFDTFDRGRISIARVCRIQRSCLCDDGAKFHNLVFRHRAFDRILQPGRIAKRSLPQPFLQ